ncbi:MAG: hypothetical protein QNJ34_12200 [Xenococcaceae cyanobacterium MO_188.B29]|nr:hypothetical protein [Xenococcaceae cyanobacterium MO_188.B29]
MSLIEDDFLLFSKKMKDFMGLTEEKLSNPSQKNNFSLPLTKMGIKAFEGLCAVEGKSVKEKVAELIKNYIEEKRKLMEE